LLDCRHESDEQISLSNSVLMILQQTGQPMQGNDVVLSGIKHDDLDSTLIINTNEFEMIRICEAFPTR
jgi:hypothetical protein